MTIEMNPQDKEGLDCDFDSNHDCARDAESKSSPGLELDVEPGYDPDLVPYFEYVPRGSELREELSRILAMTSELESVRFLSDPKDIYSRNRRMELQRRLSLELHKLQQYEVRLSREVARCQRNLDRIQADSAELNLPEARGYYSEAEYQQQKQFDEAIRDRDAVSWVITKVQAALSSSRISSFPARSPLSHLPSPTSQDYPGGLGKEIDGLLSYGPLRQYQRKR